MAEGRVVTRQVVSLSRGAKFSAIAGVLLLVAAAYLLVVPLEKPSRSGQPFKCGSAANPADGDFAWGICEGQVTRFRLASGALVVAALIVGVGIGSVFGVDRRIERRLVEDEADELAPPTDAEKDVSES